MISGKNILIGITGGIAAYKSAYLVREFIKAGANVKCIQTPASKTFVTPLTLSTLSKNEVFSEFTSDEENPRWNDHVSLALWADYLYNCTCNSQYNWENVSRNLRQPLNGYLLIRKMPCVFCASNGFRYVSTSFHKSES